MVGDVSNCYTCKEKKRLIKTMWHVRSGDVADPAFLVGGWGDGSPVRCAGHLIHPLSVTMEGPQHSTDPAYVVLHSQIKEFVYRVNTYFLQEKASRAPLLPVTQARKRTADAAGISEATVKRICSKENRICDTVPHPNPPVFTSLHKKPPWDTS